MNFRTSKALALAGAGNGSEVARLFKIKMDYYGRKNRKQIKKQEENQRLTLRYIGIPLT
jgi:hypothetical protein